LAGFAKKRGGEKVGRVIKNMPPSKKKLLLSSPKRPHLFPQKEKNPL